MENCFFLCLSQHFENHQENHPYYRHLIYQYILQNKEILKHFFYKEANETTEKYENRYNTFIEQIDTDCNYAGDFEISAASITLYIGIYILKKALGNYEFLQYYNNQEGENSHNIYII